jgi:hypothetical protein
LRERKRERPNAARYHTHWTTKETARQSAAQEKEAREGKEQMSFGLILAIAAVIGFVLMLLLLSLRSIGTHPKERPSDLEALIEASGTAEQQRLGRERGRIVRALVPNRPLSFDEKLALKSIIGSDLKLVTERELKELEK